MATAVDYSFARPEPAALVHAGYSIVWRYLGGPRDGRALQPPERDRLHGAGLRIALVHQANAVSAEASIKRPLTGWAGGLEDSGLGNRYADALGAPAWLPIFTPVDVGYGFPSPADYDAIRAYFAAHLATSPRPVGAYGPYPVLEMLGQLEHGGRRIEHFWQTAGASGSGSGSGGSIQTGDGSYRKLTRLACAFQHYGFTQVPQTDHNDVLTPDWGHWSWHPNDAGPGEPDETQEDDDMKPAIWWSAPDSHWITEVGGFPPGSGPHGFIVRAGNAQHIPDGEALESARFELVLAGGKPDPEGDDQGMEGWATVWERHGVPDAAFRTVHLQGPGGIASHPHDAEANPDQLAAGIAARLPGVSAESIRQAVNDALAASPLDPDAIVRSVVAALGAAAAAAAGSLGTR